MNGHSDERDECTLTLNTAGSVCKNHSSMGYREGLAGKYVIPFLVWIFQRMQEQEDIIVHECTQHHQSQKLLERYLGSSHTIFCWLSSPDFHGFPMTRRRRLSICVAKKLLVDWAPSFALLFSAD